METLAPHLPPVLLVRPDSGVLDGAFRSEEVAIHHLRADLIYLEALLGAVPVSLSLSTSRSSLAPIPSKSMPTAL